MVILLSVILTGLCLVISLSAGEHAQMGAAIPKNDASFYAAEAGAQQAVWKFKHDNSWRATTSAPFTGSINMYNTTWNYSVTCTSQVGDALLAWKFDEGSGPTTMDSTGLGNIGTLHGGVAWLTPGRSGSCVQLDGATGYIDCGSNSYTNLVGDMTFAAWIKLNSGSNDQKVGGNQSNSGGGYKLSIYNTKVEFEVRDAGNFPHIVRDVSGGTVLTLGTWYHVVGVYCESGHYLKTYVNGKIDRTLQGDGTGWSMDSVPVHALASSNGSFVMGKEPVSNAWYLNGCLDDVRLWNRVLSAAEIKSLCDTTVTIHSTVTGSGVSNTTTFDISVPAPSAPTIPAITTGKAMAVKNLTVDGDLAIGGNVDNSAGSSTVSGDLTYTGAYVPNAHLNVQGDANPAASISLPAIDYAYLHNQASNYGQVVNSSSSGQTFSFNSLYGNKVIWIKGNLTNPTVTIGGLWASGGTIVVDGTVTLSAATTTLGSAGYPVYIVAQGDITHSGTTLNLIGGLYTTGNLNHKTCNVTGQFVANKVITNSAAGQCVFSGASLPWFDNRSIPQPPALPMYTANHVGVGP